MKRILALCVTLFVGTLDVLADENDGCQVYPIALSSQTLQNVVPGDEIRDILNGPGNGNFGWLTWTGNRSAGTLAKSLKAPGNSDKYVNPDDPTDHQLSTGDWVEGKPWVSNTKSVRLALNKLRNRPEIVIPVWDQTRGSGKNIDYRVSGFARVRIISHKLNAKRITAKFLGYTLCDTMSSCPISHWDFDDVDDGIARDITGHGHDGVIVGASSVPGPQGSALHFDGDSDRVEVASAPDLEFAGELSISAWIKIDDRELDRYMRIVSKKVRWREQAGYEIEYNPARNRLKFGGRGRETYLAFDVDLDTEWHHVAVTLTESANGGTLIPRLYLDGAELPGTAYAIYNPQYPNAHPPKPSGELEMLIASNAALAIGRQGGGTSALHFLGAIDDVRICDRPVIPDIGNRRPQAIDQVVLTDEDTEIAFQLEGTDPDGDVITFDVTTMPAQGVLSGAPPNLVFTPNDDFNGADEFSFTVSDGKATSAPGEVSITVAPVNDPPAFKSDPIVKADAIAQEPYSASLANEVDDPDADDTFTFEKISGPSWLTIASGGALAGTPAINDGGKNEFQVRVTDAGGLFVNGTLEIEVVVTNTAPIADAGPDQSVLAGASVHLDGSHSSDPEGQTLIYQWAWSTRPPGSTAVLSNSATVRPSFIADVAGAYVIELVVSDGTFTSPPDRVHINATAVNVAPRVSLVAPNDGEVFAPGASVPLRAIVTDPDSAMVAVEFFADGIKVGEANTPPYLTGHVFTDTKSYVITATATDDAGATGSADALTLTIAAVNHPPVVNAGPDERVGPGNTVQLNGSVDDDGLPQAATYTYEWRVVSGPPGGTAQFEPPTGSASGPSFVAPSVVSFSESGTYVLALTASDGAKQDADEVVVDVNIANQTPTVEVGPDRVVVLNEAVKHGKILVAHDDWIFRSGGGFSLSGDDTWNFIENISGWFAGGKPGKFLVRQHSGEFGGNGEIQGQLAAQMLSQGITWEVTGGPHAPPPSNLDTYDALFVLQYDKILREYTNLLIDYVKSGGNVYIVAGIFEDVSQGTNAFLQEFGLQYEKSFNHVRARAFSVESSHELFQGVSELYYNHGNDVELYQSSSSANPYAEVILYEEDHGLFGIYDPSDSVPNDRHGKIVVNHDEWTFTNAGVDNAPEAYVFMSNIVSWFVEGAAGGNFLARGNTHPYFGNCGIYQFGCDLGEQNLFREQMELEGRRWTLQRSTESYPADLSQYDAILVGYNDSIFDRLTDVNRLIDYVKSGGNVYVLASGYSISPSAHVNVFLNSFGLLYGETNNVSGITPTNSTHLLFDGVPNLFYADGNDVGLILDTDGELIDPYAKIISYEDDHGLIGVYAQPSLSFKTCGTIADDGLPTGGELTLLWKQVNGPSLATIVTPGSACTELGFTGPGEYTFTLTANDGELEHFDSIVVSVVEASKPPSIDAGADQSVDITDEVLVSGSFSNLPPGVTTNPEWSLLEGPEGVTFANPYSLATAVSVTNTGLYVLNLSDSNHGVSDTMIIIVTDGTANTAPAVYAGPGQNITLGETAVLSPVVHDDTEPSPPGLTTTIWTVLQEPTSGAAVFSPGPNVSAPEVSFSEVGEYLLQLTADDSVLSASDTVTIIVDDASTPLNRSPVVDLGPDRIVELGDPLSTTVTVTPALYDDGLLDDYLTLSWSKISGPGFVSVTPTGNGAYVINFDDRVGIYTIQLSADDGELTGFDTLNVAVTSEETEAPSIAWVNPNDGDYIKRKTPIYLEVETDDLDGSVTLVEYFANGMKIAESHDAPSFKVEHMFAGIGEYVLTATATDNSSTKTTLNELRVTIGFARPTLTLISPIDGDTFAPGENIIFEANASDADGTIQDVEFFVDGNPLGRIASAPYVVTIPVGALTIDTHAVSAVATDNEGLTAEKSVTIEVVDDIGTDPAVEITAPADAAEITAPTSVTGTADSPLFDRYELQYRFKQSIDDPAAWITFGSGVDPVVDGELGVFDPTLLLNGIYEIRLRVTDDAGTTTTAGPETVVVDGAMKVGHVQLAFEDLNVPVSGLPIRVVRTYDSRDKRVGDFGVGWHVGVYNIRLQKNRNLGVNWQQSKTGGGGQVTNWFLNSRRDRIVTITFPDDEVFQFKATTAPASQIIFPITSANLLFEPINGTIGTLEIDGDPAILTDGFEGNTNLLDPNTLAIFNPTRFRFTTREGLVYILDERRGLIRMTDRNGNTLTIDENGVTHSSGKSIVFSRDAMGRIGAITDPNGNVIRYDYDANGDLVTFTNRVGDVNAFTYYDAPNAHHLKDILDGRGIRAATNEYDTDGRLIGQLDADNNLMQFLHGLDVRSETIIDRLGHTTIHEYDERGNVISTTDALGNVTTRTYDAFDNELTVTDALGHTTTKTYDPFNNLLTESQQVTDEHGNVVDATTTTTYDSNRSPLTSTDARGNTTTFSYDVKGNLITQTDAEGHVTSFSYDGAGNISTTTDAEGNPTEFEYDQFGNQTSVTVKDSNGVVLNSRSQTYDGHGNQTSMSTLRTLANGTVETLVTSFEYDAERRLTKTTHPDGTTTRTIYNTIGKEATRTDELGRETSMDYDDRGNLVRTTFPDGSMASATYDAQGRRVSSTDQLGRVTQFFYDALGRTIRTDHPDGATETTTYDAIGRTIQSTDANGNPTLFEYDPVCGCGGRRTKIIDALGNEAVYGHDPNGNQIRVTDANGHITEFEFDRNNRSTRTVFHNGTYAETVYDGLGRRAAQIDQEGKRIDFEYDGLGRLIKVIQPAPNTGDQRPETHYEYDEVGNLMTQIDAEGRPTRYEYDRRGRRVARLLPMLQVETASYDAAGNLETKTDFNGFTTTYEYDHLNRRVAENADPSHPSLSLAHAPARVEYNYDAAGNRRAGIVKNALSNTVYSDTWSYDSRNRLVSQDSPHGLLSYSYDPVGNLVTVGSGNIDGLDIGYTYDQLNRLKTVSDSNVGVPDENGYAYDAVGNLSASRYSNGLTTTWNYDALNRLTDMATVDSSNVLHTSFVYTLRNSGHRARVVEASGRTVDYRYDNLYRLTSEIISDDGTGAAGGRSDWTYDRVGNRRSQVSSIAGVSDQTPSYDDNDRLLSNSYDDNGNTVNSGSGNDVYDFKNRLIRRSKLDSVVIDLMYSANGDRVRKTIHESTQPETTHYLVDRNNHTGYAQVVEELRDNGSGFLDVFRTYTYGLDLISQNQLLETSPGGFDWAKHYYLYDGLGTVRALADKTGAATDTYTYGAFGEILRSIGVTPNLVLYTGEQFDPDLGLYFLRARYLDTNTGRFWTKDPFEGLNREPVSLNKYLYASGNPVSFVDPSGNLSLGVAVVTMAIAGLLLATFAQDIFGAFENSVFSESMDAIIAIGDLTGHIDLLALDAAWSMSSHLAKLGYSPLVDHQATKSEILGYVRHPSVKVFIFIGHGNGEDSNGNRFISGSDKRSIMPNDIRTNKTFDYVGLFSCATSGKDNFQMSFEEELNYPTIFVAYEKNVSVGEVRRLADTGEFCPVGGP